MINSQIILKRKNFSEIEKNLKLENDQNLNSTALEQTPKKKLNVNFDFLNNKITLKKKKQVTSRAKIQLIHLEKNFVKELSQNKKNELIWKQQLKYSQNSMNQTVCSNMIQYKVSASIIQKVYAILYPNFQNLNEKIFKIYLNRARKILSFQLQPLFHQESIRLIRKTLCLYFSQQFNIKNLEIIQNIESIFMAFCVHRMDIGFIRELVQLTIVLFSLLNKNTIMVFNILCNILTCKPVLSLITKNSKQIQFLESKFEQKLKNSSTILYIILIKKYNFPLKSYLHQWFVTCFMDIYFENYVEYLDFLFNQDYMLYRKNSIIDKIFNFLFLNKFSADTFIKITVSIIISMEKSIIKNSISKENLFNILRRPRGYMDQQIFSDYLFNQK